MFIAKTIELYVKNMFQIENYQISVSIITLERVLLQSTLDNLLDEILKIEKNRHNNCELLLIDSEAIAGFTHLKACINFAIKAFQQKNNIANSLKTEILLYLSGNRQISKAISKVGINVKTTKIVFLHLVLGNQNLCELNDIQELLSKMEISFKEITKDCELLPLLNEKKIRKNLQISNEEIELLLDKDSKNREEIIEKLAIEKSALLNVNK